ncbi:hypothetical protein FOCC_FOCC008649 [Frankliniella occidentalis]|uniref:Uncharacterized protein LOC113203923 n=1 Tax=Frankliniella occidentalis TaxID=133901 RepID=A0A6J1S212_FRAOC|nr:uncharacterized protein LOC113203923 [Frankliniella occidentalis]KAE8744741.1 hypothetical protein FOCC_FOCC008649 [Frankliniella occidentalis]
MAKTFLLAAFAAVLFTVAFSSPAPALLAQRAEALQQLDDTDLQALGLDKHNLRFNWINVTAILEKIENALNTVEVKIAEVTAKVEDALQGVLQGIENAALNAAVKWNQTVVELAEKAEQAGVDIRDCIEQEQPLSEVIEGLKNDTRTCVANQIDEVKKALGDVTDVGGLALDLLDRAKKQVAECSKAGNFIASGLCLAATTPALDVEAVGLVAEAVFRAGIAAVKAGALAPLTTLCDTKATAGRAAQATAIVDATAKCIQGKLFQ